MKKKKLPKFIERIDDGELFVRNKNGTYSLLMMKRDFPKSFTFEYTYEELMGDSKNFREFIEKRPMV